MSYGFIRVVALVLLMGAVSCQQGRQQGPEMAPAAETSSYAVEYPDKLAKTRGAISQQEKLSDDVAEKFSTFVQQLTEPDYDLVGRIYEAADGAGRNGAYAKQLDENRSVATFLNEEKEEIYRKVGGAAQYTADKAGCKAKGLYGATQTALDKTIQKQLTERLRRRNPAHELIDDNAESLGARNAETLRVQADAIAFVSFVVHISLEVDKQQLQADRNQAVDVKRTLQNVVERSEETAKDAAASEAKKQAAAKRGENAQQAYTRIELELQETDKALKDMDQRIRKARETYQEAFKKLKDEVVKKAKESPGAASVKK